MRHAKVPNVLQVSVMQKLVLTKNIKYTVLLNDGIEHCRTVPRSYANSHLQYIQAGNYERPSLLNSCYYHKN